MSQTRPAETRIDGDGLYQCSQTLRFQCSGAEGVYGRSDDPLRHKCLDRQQGPGRTRTLVARKSNGFAVAPVSQRIAVIGTPEDRLHRRQLHADLPDTAQSTQYAGTGASGRCIYLELPDGSDHIRNAESSFAGLVLALGQ